MTVHSIVSCSQRVALLFGLLITAGVANAGVVVDKSVDGQAGPWDAALNAALHHYGVADNLSPTVFDASDGLTFSAGDTMTIEYVSGLTSAFGGAPVVDGAGYIGLPFKNDDPGSSGMFFPSLYMDFSMSDIFLNALVGTFADSTGMIVGTPFAVNNGPLTVVVPVGASQLQLGVNDDIFVDNTGALVARVSQNVAAVPEPGSFTLLILGLAFLGRISTMKRGVSP